jgi:hypothetical protein
MPRAFPWYEQKKYTTKHSTFQTDQPPEKLLAKTDQWNYLLKQFSVTIK